MMFLNMLIGPQGILLVGHGPSLVEGMGVSKVASEGGLSLLSSVFPAMQTEFSRQSLASGVFTLKLLPLGSKPVDRR